jgi:hypothetical protein
MQVTVVVGTISHWDNVAGTRPAGFTIAYLFEKMRLRWGRLLRSREWAQEGSWSGSLMYVMSWYVGAGEGVGIEFVSPVVGSVGWPS